jgi:4-diphosphocytidyl-2-C-methyl-D-erythritol kinase
MIKPNCSVSTKEAYAGIIRHPEVEGQIKTALTEGFSFDAMRPLLINDFEQTVFPHHPEIPQIKQHLLSAGAVYAAMSGSGSTVFGLFENMPATHSAAQWLHNEFGEMLIFDNKLV